MDGHCQFNKRINYTYDIFRYVFYASNNTWIYNIIYGYMGLFYIYSKEDRRIIMAKKIDGMDKINDTTLHELLLMMDARLKHIEDISADNRAIIVKLVKQSNQIVDFLKQLELEVNDLDYGIEAPPSFGDTIDREKLSERRMIEVKEILEEFKSKREDLKEFEEELKKHKDKLTPGQVGES
jgi:hypothetical protein|tara:strand:+ start:342 stop:884 length:543 start_codon:yes stop_codon:yes gene_type:complete